MRKILMLVLSVTVITMTFTVNIFADYNVPMNSAYYDQMSNTKVQQKFLEGIDAIDKYIEGSGSSVVEELTKEKSRLEAIYKTETDNGNKSKLDKLIHSYSNMISEYGVYKSKDKSSGITISGVENPVLSTAVAAIVSYFTMSKYYLAAELLTYAKESSNGGEYEPYFVSNVRSTTEFSRLKSKIINSGRATQSGTSNFEKGNTTADKDLYYALHGYSYDYESGLLAITDYYDFAYSKDYDGIAGTAVNTMYMAQLLGVIVPYDVRIELVV